MANHQHSETWLAIQRCKAIQPIVRKAALKYLNKVEKFCIAATKNDTLDPLKFGIHFIYRAGGIYRTIYQKGMSPSVILGRIFPWERAFITVGKALLTGDAAYHLWWAISKDLERMEVIEAEANKLKVNRIVKCK